MKNTLRFVLPLTVLALFLVPVRSPAPIIYREGEGFLPGELEDIEIKKNAEEQFNLAERYAQAGDYKHAGASYRLVVRRFPRSDLAASAQFKSGEMYERSGDLDRAFNEYQSLVEKYPRSPDFERALEAQYDIGKAYLDGKPVKVYGIPTLPSMERASNMFSKIIRNAPYSRVAPLAQFGVGQALEKTGSIQAAVTAYRQVSTRYPNSDVADDAMYQIGYVYLQASRETGYDQTAAVRAQEAFEDFLLKYPNSEKVSQARDNLKTLQGRKSTDSYNIARFYDKQRNYKAAYVYYNQVLQQQPDSAEAERAKQRMNQIRSRLGDSALQIGSAQPAVTAAGPQKLQAQVDTPSRPDFVGPPAPAASPSPKADQTAPEQKPLRTPPSNAAPVEPALPSQ
jgi:outer membrane protein assembly factor BamD